jgi:hypothetical protein
MNLGAFSGIKTPFDEGASAHKLSMSKMPKIGLNESHNPFVMEPLFRIILMKDLHLLEISHILDPIWPN